MTAREPEEAGGRPLRDVYSVALGVALVLAVEQVIDLERGGVPVRTDALLTFLAFIATGFSLYHWATRFIDLFFSLEDRARTSGATVAALLVGSTELLLLIALSALIARPFVFLGGLAVVLGFEVLAGLSLQSAGAYGSASGFGRRYLWVNAAAFVLSLAGILTAGWIERDAVTGVLALIISWGRAAAFYRVGFKLLFGRMS